MKLLVQSDDYGFTKGVTAGILDAIEHGIVTCTGMFVNMPASAKAALEIKKFPDVCLGIDFNIVSGHCIADLNELPNLVDENGLFIRSVEKYRNPDFGKRELWPYHEVEIELRAQIQAFQELTGRMPEYFHPHSISEASPAYIQVIRDLSIEFQIPYSRDIRTAYHFKELTETWSKKPFTIENQLTCDAVDFMVEHANELLDSEYSYLSGHVGYVDSELFHWSTCNIQRCKDHEMMTSEYMKNWIIKHEVELISYRDLKRL